MNINSKVIIASTLLTALFAGSYAIAGDNEYFISKAVYSTSESVVIQNAIFNTVEIDTDSTFERGNR